MKKEDKNKIVALFIVIMFVGSAIAFAIISAAGPEETQESSFIVTELLTNQQEAYYLQQNIVILRYYYSQDCITCSDAEQAVIGIGNFFSGRVLIELIDVEQYPEETKEITVPTIYLKGKTTKTITSDFDINEIYLDICTMFFAPVQECSI